jgi:hypothetical protein
LDCFPPPTIFRRGCFLNLPLFQDAIFAKYRPGTFLPALCHVFMDTDAPLEVLESAARAITYFLEVHVDSTARKVVEVSGAVKAFCKALVIFPSNDNVDPDSARVSRYAWTEPAVAELCRKNCCCSLLHTHL